MRIARNLALAALCGLALATAPRLASAQFMPDYPAGGSCAQPKPDQTSFTASAASMFSLRDLLRIRPSLFAFGWSFTPVRNRATTRTGWLASRIRAVR